MSLNPPAEGPMVSKSKLKLKHTPIQESLTTSLILMTMSSTNLVYKELSRLQCDQIELRTAVRQVRHDIENLRDEFKTQFGLMNDAFMARLAKLDAMVSQRMSFIEKTTMAQTSLCHSFSQSIHMLQQTTTDILIAATKASADAPQTEAQAAEPQVDAPQAAKAQAAAPPVCSCFKTTNAAPGCSYCESIKRDINHSYFE